MPTSAQNKMLKTHGFYKCGAPKAPYRVYAIDPLATASYNFLYLMGFVRQLNEGRNVVRDAAGKVRCTISGAGWVHAIAAPGGDENVDGGGAVVYMVGIPQPVAFILRNDSKDAARCVDFTTNCSDALGFYVLPTDDGGEFDERKGEGYHKGF